MIIRGDELKAVCKYCFPVTPVKEEHIGIDSVDVTLNPTILKFKGSAHGQSFFLDKAPSAKDRQESLKVENALFDRVQIDPYFVLEPGMFIKAKVAEYFSMPNNYTGIFSLKSAHAQLGLQQAVSVFIRPSWEGALVLELTNTSPLRLVLTADMRIGQVHFFKTVDEILEM